MMRFWKKRTQGEEGGAAPPAEAPPSPEVRPQAEAAGEPGDGAVPARRPWRKRQGLLFLTGLLAVVLIILAVNVLPGILFPQHPKYFILRVDFSTAGTDVTSLTSFGPRLTGTTAEGEGANYIAQQFKNAGLTGVEVQEYNVTCYAVDRAQLWLVEYVMGLVPNKMVSPEEFRHKSDFVVGAYSGSYVFNRWTDDLEVVDVGNGSDAALWAGARNRAVIVTNDGGIGNTALYLQSWQMGARACLIHNTVMDADIGYPAVCFSMDAEDSKGHTIPLPDNYSGNGPDLPCLMVSKKTGETIKEAIPAQSKIRMDIQVTIGKRPVRVVVGERRGNLNPDRIVMLGAHHDTVYSSVGAVDNTAGVAALIGIAREIGELTPADTIRFATFGGEEEGLLGSYEYFKAYSDKLKGKLQMFLNLDMCNIDRKRDHRLPIVVSDARYLDTLAEIKAEAYDRIPELSGYEVLFYQGNLTSSSDMATFALEGYKVASCWGSGCYEYHTPKDDTSHINSESFLVVGAIYGSFALHLAGGRN